MKALRGRARSFERKALHLAGDAVARHRMIGSGDHVVAALSGGKDSYVLLHVLSRLRARSPVPWRLSAVAVDPGVAGFPLGEIRRIAGSYACPLEVERTSIFDDVPAHVRRSKDFCSLCSRFRRGALLRVARRMGAGRLALGHHRGDVLETLLLNLCFSGRFAAMAPVLPSAGGTVTVIRPLLAVPSNVVEELAAALGVPRHRCPRGDDTRRTWARGLLERLAEANPRVEDSLMSALRRPVPGHLLRPEGCPEEG